ncbi:hypothetical protein BGX23_001759 [Mortierella sp. AD031]|nr:hypothetical protein BGX23_001759 [Mortierella sp. AD031]
MPIIRTIPLVHTFRRPILDTSSQQLPPSPQAQTEDEAERGHAVIEDLGDYPAELLQIRLQTLQEHLSKHHPSTSIYMASLGAVLVITIAFVATCLALGVSDGKPWVLGVIVIMILLFISKMSFLSRIEKEHNGIAKLLQTFNEQDMPHYGVLYRLRPRNYSSSSSPPSPPATTTISPTTSTTTTRTRSDWPIRLAYRLNLGLPCWALDLTTIDHIDEFSFQDHPATDPHASPEEILARENELPTYRPKADQDDEDDQHQQHPHRVLGEALPPQYTDVVELQIDPSPSSGSHPADQEGSSSQST